MFNVEDHPDVLVGLAEPDDAAVWRLDDSRALVVTTDFFTPVVDDAYDYGAIAAANALSDLYAMGAKPIMALNMAGFPADLPPDLVEEIFRGGAEKVKEAGAVISGGHTIQDQEPKYGLVALGLASLDQLMTKSAAEPGDVLVLSKPLGTGVITTALKREIASPEHVAAAVDWMKMLNDRASALALQLGIRAVTDITGFGLLGHAQEVAAISGVGLGFFLRSIPFMAGADGYARAGAWAGGSADNMRYFGARVEFSSGIDEIAKMLLFDAQTSGGLLLSVPETALSSLMENAKAGGVPMWPVGQVTAGQGIQVLDARMEWDYEEAGDRGVWFYPAST
jgi:selenide,water dikinase